MTNLEKQILAQAKQIATLRKALIFCKRSDIDHSYQREVARRLIDNGVLQIEGIDEVQINWVLFCGLKDTLIYFQIGVNEDGESWGVFPHPNIVDKLIHIFNIIWDFSEIRTKPILLTKQEIKKIAENMNNMASDRESAKDIKESFDATYNHLLFNIKHYGFFKQ